MLYISEKYNDGGEFYRRLNSISSAKDAVANDVKYHLRCWASAKQQVAIKDKLCVSQEIDETANVIADIEILNILRTELSDLSHKIITTNQIELRYRDLLRDNGMKDGNMNKSYKKYLKNLIEENLENVSFVKSPRVNEPDRLCSKDARGHAIDVALKNCEAENFDDIFRVAKVIRTELEHQKRWKFKGQFDDFEVPVHLSNLLRWILIGPSKELKSESRQRSLEKCVSLATQFMIQSFKTNRQIRYKPKENSNLGTSNSIETPFSVGLGLLIHQKTRSKYLIDTLYDMNLSISSNKVACIKRDVEEVVKKDITKCNGVFIPSCVSPGDEVFFAIDNTDLQIDTPDGQKQLHGTAMAIFQQKQQNQQNQQNTNHRNLQLDRSTKLRKTSDQPPLYQSLFCPEPRRENATYTSYSQLIDSETLEEFHQHDMIWTLMKSLIDLSINVPTWAAYNSILSTNGNPTIYSSLPVLNGSPTDWSNLYSALKIVQGINTVCTPHKKTIVTLDLQLYAKCIQLQSRGDISSNFIFRLGELHIVFAMLKAIGKYVDNSGLDEIFRETEIYGPTTLEQIKGGKHMKRSFEAFHTLYTALFTIYIQTFLESHPLLEKEMREGVTEAITTLEKLSFKDSPSIAENHDSFLQLLIQIDYFNEKIKFDQSLVNQGRFLLNFMKMFESLLLFVRATRQNLWNLHLASLDQFVRYFFVFDLFNYARYSPIYLAQMFDLEASDPETWRFFDNGNFSVSKSDIPFCSIGVDHALEQENRSMKVLGGIKGIGNNLPALDQHFLITTEMNRIVDEFRNNLQLTSGKRARHEHYQIVGGTNSRMTRNVLKLTNALNDRDITFEKSDTVYNIVSKRVLTEQVAKEFLELESDGNNLYKSFREERIEGNKSVFDTMKKRKLPTFKSTNKSVKVKLKDRVIALKEDRKLMIRFIIASRKRPEIDLEKYLGQFEFSVVPRSLFSSDGKLLLGSDKSTVMHRIEDAIQQATNTEAEQGGLEAEIPTPMVAIFDGMAVVNKIKLGQAIQNCQQFADAFLKIVLDEATSATEIRIVFDRYLNDSLKESTREKRNKDADLMEFEVKGDTSLKNLTLKKFLSHIKTKQRLTIFLGRYLSQALQNSNKMYAVSFDTVTISNIAGIGTNLNDNKHEEADTLMILHAIDVACINPFRQLHIFSPDTDVFLLLIHYYTQLPTVTIFETGRGNMKRKINVGAAFEVMGRKKSEALLGFHAFTGCDQTSKFNGKSKLACWKVFIDANDAVIDAFTELGNNEEVNDEVFKQLETYVVTLFSGSRFSNTVATLAEARWQLYSKYQDCDKLPPTRAALRYKVLRSNLISLTWKTSHMQAPTTPDPEQHGWQKSDGILMPVLTDMPPSPEVLIEMSSRKCKTGCITMRCKCKKNNLVCTEMCLCVDCQNDDEEEHNNNPSWSDYDDDESNDGEDEGLSGEDDEFSDFDYENA